MIMTNQPVHYSGYKFYDYQMLDGRSQMPSPFGGTEVGHEGDGAVIITKFKIITPTIKKPNRPKSFLN